MNKYDTALYRIRGLILENGKIVENFSTSDVKTLQELVDKETPKKILEVSKEEYELSGYKYCCPICGQLVGTITKDGNIEPDDYCCSCGQKLDWRVKDDE
jgi:predicted SprT family Zn-dependent metalloprotease